MNCAFWVSNNEEALRVLPGVEKAVVNPKIPSGQLKLAGIIVSWTAVSIGGASKAGV